MEKSEDKMLIKERKNIKSKFQVTTQVLIPRKLNLQGHILLYVCLYTEDKSSKQNNIQELLNKHNF